MLARVQAREHKAAERTLFWVLMLLIAAVAACIDRWCLDAADWTEATGHGAFVALCAVALTFFGKAIRPFPWVIPVAAAVTCARRWCFDAPTWTAALDAGLVTALVLLVILHLMRR